MSSCSTGGEKTMIGRFESGYLCVCVMQVEANSWKGHIGITAYETQIPPPCCIDTRI